MRKREGLTPLVPKPLYSQRRCCRVSTCCSDRTPTYAPEIQDALPPSSPLPLLPPSPARSFHLRARTKLRHYGKGTVSSFVRGQLKGDNILFSAGTILIEQRDGEKDKESQQRRRYRKIGRYRSTNRYRRGTPSHHHQFHEDKKRHHQKTDRQTRQTGGEKKNSQLAHLRPRLHAIPARKTRKNKIKCTALHQVIPGIIVVT